MKMNKLPTKQRFGSRRKNKTPRRVVRVDAESEKIEYEQNVIALPKDPVALAEYISERLPSEFFEVPAVPKLYFQIVDQAVAEAPPGAPPIFMCACKKSYRSAPGLQYHLLHNCPAVPELVFTCLICQMGLPTHDAIADHVQEVHVYPYISVPTSLAASRRAAHSSRLKIQMFAESSSVAEELEKTCSSLSDFEEEDKAEIPKVKTFPSASETRKRSKGTVNSPGLNMTYASLERPLAKAFKWTFKERRDLEKKFPLILPDLSPSLANWVKVDDITVLHKQCNLKGRSPCFVIETDSLTSTKKTKKKGEKGKKSTSHVKKDTTSKESNLNYQKLKLFQSLNVGNSKSHTFYAGGPVWSMDWCPCPTSSEPSTDQFLALSTHCGEHMMEPDITYNEPVVVQLWNCGSLPLKSSGDLDQVPHFSYGILLDIGPVWSMHWCPVAESILNLTSKCERLGLLALACASGDVYIFAMPKPNDSLHDTIGVDRSETSHCFGRGNIFRAKPTCLLKPVRVGNFGQCMCLSWSRNNGCHLVAAGFASGHVALWDLDVKSKLISSEDNGVRVLYAFHTLRAHSKVVRDVAWCPFDSNIFVTVGADRFMRLWDQRNTDADIPHSLPQKMSVMYELNWSVLWCGVYASSDSVFSIPYFHGCMHLNVGTGTNPLQSVAPLKATSWTVTSCDWLNGVATGDVSGNALINTCNNWNRSYISNKRYPRMLLYHADAEWNKPHASSAYLERNPSTVPADNSDYNLIFHDCDVTAALPNWQDLGAHTSVRTHEDFLDESYDFPAAAVHKVRWNTNMSSFSWIASGTHSGLVRLHCASGLLSHEFDAIMSKVLDPK